MAIERMKLAKLTMLLLASAKPTRLLRANLTIKVLNKDTPTDCTMIFARNSRTLGLHAIELSARRNLRQGLKFPD